MNLEKQRNELNSHQQALREALTADCDAPRAIELFFSLHGILHSKRVAPEADWSYEDSLLNGLEEEQFRQIPEDQEHSIAWIIWHLSRIEDVTMNLLVAGRDQVFEQGDWLAKTKSPVKHTGNGTGIHLVKRLSQQVDVSALREYRYAVGRATREVVQTLVAGDFTRKMHPDHLQRIIDEGAVVEAGMEAVDYWGSRDVAGLLLMPATRHTIIHWNEARQLIHRLE